MSSASAVPVSSPLPRRAVNLAIRSPIVLLTAALFIILSLEAPAFLTTQNLSTVLRQSSPLGVMACAQTLLMISGGFDISVGAVYALSGVAFASLWSTSPVLALAVALGIGLGVGCCNGMAVALFKINPFMATLGSQLIVRGIILPFAASGVIFVQSTGFQELGTGSFMGVSLQIWTFAVVAVLIGWILSSTRFGRHVYAVGGNAKAAHLAGIRVRSIRVAAFSLSGLSASIAGMLHTSEVGAAQADVGVGIEFTVLAAVVLGGTSLFGGRGTIWRTIVAVAFLAFLQNGFNLIALAPFYQEAITGVILLVAVAADGLVRQGREVG
jgi:ribose transport system permease protein